MILIIFSLSERKKSKVEILMKNQTHSNHCNTVKKWRILSPYIVVIAHPFENFPEIITSQPFPNSGIHKQANPAQKKGGAPPPSSSSHKSYTLSRSYSQTFFPTQFDIRIAEQVNLKSLHNIRVFSQHLHCILSRILLIT